MTARELGRPQIVAAPPVYTEIDVFRQWGLRACVTTRGAGDLGLSGVAPIGEVLARWNALRSHLGCYGGGSRFATSVQVHGTRVLLHGRGWEGWLRADEADGHVAPDAGTGLGITVADCVPVFLAHPSRAVGLVHAGWRGTAGGIVKVAIDQFQTHGLAPADLHIYLGPAICAHCYEVGPDVYTQLTGSRADGPRSVDLRALIADQAHGCGVRTISISSACTQCDNDLYFSHRAGDAGRQVAALANT